MTRLIDADKLCEEFKDRQRAALRWKERSILEGDEERSIRADATLAFLSEVKLTIDNAPTVDTDLSKYSDKLWKAAYERGKNERPHGEWIKGREISREMIYDKILHIDYENFTCSNCGLVLDNLLYHVDGSPFYKFCPNCGADMRGEENV